MREWIGIGIGFPAGTPHRLSVHNVKHLCKHEQDNAQGQQEGCQTLNDVEYTTNEH